MRWYWLRYVNGVPVVFRLARPYSVRWKRIHGVQIGSWFIGAVRSADVPVPPYLKAETRGTDA